MVSVVGIGGAVVGDFVVEKLIALAVIAVGRYDVVNIKDTRYLILFIFCTSCIHEP